MLMYSCINQVREHFLCCVRIAYLLALFLVLLPPLKGRADDLDLGTVEGLVTDPAGSAVAGALVQVQDESTGIGRRTKSNASGWYRISSIPPGIYSVEAEAMGFQIYHRPNLKLGAGQTLRMDLRFEIATVRISMDVNAPQEGELDPSRTVVGVKLETQDLRDTPIRGRDPFELVLLFSNVQAEPLEIRDLGEPSARDIISQPPQEAGLFSLSGARAYSNNVTMDGFDNNDDRLARERTSPSLEAIDEVQIITNQFAAEYGRASGGRVNFRTRRGETDYRGSGLFFFQDESMNANSFFRNAHSQARRPYQRRQYAGRLGGPMVRRPWQLFFFGAYERRDEPDRDAIFALLPIDPALNRAYPLPERPSGRPFIRDGVTVGVFEDELDTPSSRTFLLGRIDGNWSSRHNFLVRWDKTSTGNLPTRDQGSTLASSLVNRQRDSTAYAFQDTWAGTDVVHQIRFQISTLSPSSLQRDNRVGVIVGSSRGLNFGSFSFLSGFIAGSSGFPELRSERRYQLSDSLAWRTGKHALKFGADLMYLRSATTQLNLFFGFYNFPGFSEFRDSSPSRFRQRIGNPQQVLINRIAGVFVQDEWRTGNQVTLSMGLRFDYESLLKRDRNNWGPRMAFAWDIGGKHEVAIRAGFGVFYNRVLLRTFEDFAISSRLFEIDLGSGPGATGPITALHRVGGFPNRFTNDPHDPRLVDLVRPIQQLRSIAPELRIPYSLQASVGVERQLGWDTLFEVNYVLNRSIGLWRDSNINAPIPPPGGLVGFLTRPPLGASGVVRLADGTTAFDNSARQIVDVGVPLVQFDLSDVRSRDVGSGSQRMRIYGLNALPGSSSTTDPILAALRALRDLRPNPSLGEVEQLQSDGQATYHGLNLILSKRFRRWGQLRMTYTFSKLIDNVVLNTSSPMDEFNVRLERSVGLTDARHRLVVGGHIETPRWLGKIEIAPVVQLSSGRPFNITSNGQDRNLNDTLTDRLHLQAERSLAWIRPGETSRSEAASALFSFSTIGTNGTLGRNAGKGPGSRRIDARFSRIVSLGERVRLRPSLDFYNLTNTPNFLMNGFFGPLDMRSGTSVFLQPRAARRPRNVEVGLRVEF